MFVSPDRNQRGLYHEACQGGVQASSLRSMRCLDPWCVTFLVLGMLCSFSLPALGAVPSPQQASQTHSPSSARARLDRQDLALAEWRSGWSRPVRGLYLQGLTRTDERVVRRELTVAIAKTLTKTDLVESLTRLRNLGIFRRVDAIVTPTADGVTLTFGFDEKWSTLPIVSAGRGGGRLFFRLGLQDRNLFGRYLGLRAYYWYFAGTHSAVVSLVDPRLFHRRLSGAVLLEHSNRNRFQYGDNGDLIGGWSRQRQMLTFELGDLRDPEKLYGMSLSTIRDEFSVATLPKAYRSKQDNEVLSSGLPASGWWLIAKLWGRLGRIQLDDYLERGIQATATLELARGWTQGDNDWLRGRISAKAAWLGPARLNLVAQARLALQSRAHPEHRLFVGGYTAVRGYAEGRFVGERSAVVNVEARIPSVHRRWFVLQHVLFVDGAAVQDLQNSRWMGAASAGAGIRMIVPPLVGLVARVDVAWSIGDQDWLLSFGSQQFF
ncbi:MAG: hypothetical protein CMH53_11130 [Myxococcales bacterium]|nr:hypothetical protein [Myxococcales bacterium]